MKSLSSNFDFQATVGYVITEENVKMGFFFFYIIFSKVDLMSAEGGC